MCQIHVVKRTSFMVGEQWVNHLRSGASFNSDGFAALLIDFKTGEHSLIRSMKWDVIEAAMLMDDDWTLAIIHQRFTTQGEVRLHNTHLWEEGNRYYCHNGVLSSKEANKYNVDSQLIGEHLRNTLWEALEFCQSEKYANVIVVDFDTSKYTISRSRTGSLYTDGSGQYSSNKLTGICDKAVSTNAIIFHDMDIDYSGIDYASSWDHPSESYMMPSATVSRVSNYFRCPVCDQWCSKTSAVDLDIDCGTCGSVFAVPDAYDPYCGEVLYDNSKHFKAAEKKDETITLVTEEERKEKHEELEQEQIKAIANNDDKEYNRLEKLIQALNYNASVTKDFNETEEETRMKAELDMLDSEISLLKDELQEAIDARKYDKIIQIQQDMRNRTNERDGLEYRLFNLFYREEEQYGSY